ncbi:hypothetical protein HMPREF9072_00836, partial [Capnocytophaga sp. oral taxon 324 str. F0483]
PSYTLFSPKSLPTSFWKPPFSSENPNQSDLSYKSDLSKNHFYHYPFSNFLISKFSNFPPPLVRACSSYL